MTFQEIPLQGDSRYSHEGIFSTDPDFVILPEWDKLVSPVTGLSEFDFSRPVPSIDVCRINGQLIVIDGRKRVLACRGRHPLGYRTHDFSKRKAKAEFLKRHFLVG